MSEKTTVEGGTDGAIAMRERPVTRYAANLVWNEIDSDTSFDGNGSVDFATLWVLLRDRTPTPFGRVLHFGYDREALRPEWYAAIFSRTVLPTQQLLSAVRLRPALMLHHERRDYEGPLFELTWCVSGPMTDDDDDLGGHYSRIKGGDLPGAVLRKFRQLLGRAAVP